jgi:Flagellar capping protein
MGVIGAGISINGPSGIDTASLVDQLTALEQQKVTTVQTQKDKYQVQIDAYSKLKSTLATIKTAATALNSASAFDVFKSDSSNSDIVTLKGDIGAVEGQYELSVFQLAGSEKMVSKDNFITSQSASLSSQGVTVGDISIDGTAISIDANDTVQDLRMKINNATDAQGNKLNVSASVLKISDSNYRLVLTAKNTGTTGAAYKDVTGSTFQNLGIITDAQGDKGNTAQVIQSQDDIQTAFDALAAGASIQYSGVDHNGNTVTSTYYKATATTSISDFLAQVNKTFHGMANATVETDGKLTLTDSVQGSSQLAITSLSIGGVAHTASTLTAGSEGAGVLTLGKDAYFSLDGLTLKSATNDADGYISGVTIQLHKASPTTTVQTTVSRDLDAVQKKVQAVLDAYNALSTFASDNTKMADPSNTASKSGDLAGDMTVSSIVTQVRSQLMQSFNLFGGSYNTLTMIGVKSDAQTGEMSIDQTQFTKALTNNFDEVEHIFVTTGISDNKNITLGRNTKTTQSGMYTLNEPDAEHFNIQLAGDPTWYTSDSRNGDIITFSSGPAQGLSITAPSGTIGTSNSATFTFSKGLGDRLSELVDNFNDSNSGLIATHQNSLQDQMKDADSRITMLQTRVNDYHDGLVKQFAAMEQALSTMKSQYAQMASALGLSTTSTS